MYVFWPCRFSKCKMYFELRDQLANWAISRGLYAAHMGPISGLCGAFLAVESVNGRHY